MILLQLEEWLEDEHGQRVFWLNGLAGTGKSTIAQTFAEITFAEGKLGASFFCSRDSEDRSNIQAIFPTLAFQLAYKSPAFRERLLQVLRASPGIGQERPCSQMERLAGPFQALPASQPSSSLMPLTSAKTMNLPLPFFPCSPATWIRSPVSSSLSLVVLNPESALGSVSSHSNRSQRCSGCTRSNESSVDSDIKLFFRTRLTAIAKTRSDCDFTQDWPNSSDIDYSLQKGSRSLHLCFNSGQICGIKEPHTL
jgi:hypothetical protein